MKNKNINMWVELPGYCFAGKTEDGKIRLAHMSWREKYPIPPIDAENVNIGPSGKVFIRKWLLDILRIGTEVGKNSVLNYALKSKEARYGTN